MVVPMFGLAQSIENTTLAGVCRQHVELEYPMDIIVNKLELDNPSAIANYNSLGCSSDLIFLVAHGFFFAQGRFCCLPSHFRP